MIVAQFSSIDSWVKLCCICSVPCACLSDSTMPATLSERVLPPAARVPSDARCPSSRCFKEHRLRHATQGFAAAQQSLVCPKLGPLLGHHPAERYHNAEPRTQPTLLSCWTALQRMGHRLLHSSVTARVGPALQTSQAVACQPDRILNSSLLIQHVCLYARCQHSTEYSCDPAGPAGNAE